MRPIGAREVLAQCGRDLSWWTGRQGFSFEEDIQEKRLVRAGLPFDNQSDCECQMANIFGTM